MAGFTRARADARARGVYLGWARLDRRAALARASTATRVNSAGLVVSAANDAARFDHDPVSHAARGLLVESQRTNVALNSEQLNGSPWATSRATVTPNAAIAPDGNMTADKLVENTSTGDHRISTTCAFTAGQWTYSIYAKAAERAWLWVNTGAMAGSPVARFDLQNGVLGTIDAGLAASITPVGNGWFRCALTGTVPSAGSFVILNGVFYGAGGSYAGDGVSGLYLWGSQCEAGAFASSYIPTTGSAATRAADACSTTAADFTAWLARPAKTLVVRADSPASGTRRVFHAAKTGSEATDYISIWTSDATVKATVVAGGVTQADLTLGAIAAGVPFKAAVSLAPNAVRASLNGAAEVSDASATIPACDKAWFGCGPAGEQLCGHLSGAWQFLNFADDVEALAA